MTDRIDPRRPNPLEPETPEDNPPGTLEEVAPEDPKSPMLNDRSAGPGLPVGEMSSDTPKSPSSDAPNSPSEEKKIPTDAPINPYVDPDMTEDDVPETWDEEVVKDLPDEEQGDAVPPS